MMVFCLLDTAISYEKVCQTFDELKRHGMTTRSGLRAANIGSLYNVMKECGYRWSHQKCKYLKEFANNDIDLSTATREEIVKSVKGVGMKLASMFLRNTRGKEYAVLDVHTLRWMQENYKFSNEEFKRMSYEEKEEWFIKAADFLGTTPIELDLKIWNENRIGNRK